MGSAVQAASLQGLEEASSVATAARISILGAFAAGQGYVDDGAYSPHAWLAYRTGITHGAATGHTGWVKRGRAHPRVHAALAARAVSESRAKVICQWTGRLPEASQDAADGILLAAAASGLGLADLAGLAGEMYERSRQHAPDGSVPGAGPNPDRGSGQDQGSSQDVAREHDENPAQEECSGGDEPPGETEVFEDRSVRLAMTFGGAGVIRGDLTPSAPRSSGPYWTPYRPGPGPRMTALMSSGTTMPSRRPCGRCDFASCLTHGRHAGRPGASPAQGGRVRPSERDLRCRRVGADPA